MGVKALNGDYSFYKLLKDIPGVDAGAMFYWDKEDDIYGSIGAGCLKLCWTFEGSCYKGEGNCGLCGDTIIFHASVRENQNWFQLVQEYIEPEPEIIEMTIEEIEKEYGIKVKLT